MKHMAPALIMAVMIAAAPAAASSQPVVVELFTSQGCSSCPPAEALLGEIAGRADVIALAFHVDYWNGLGWKDPFSSPAATARQRAYQTAFGRQNVYTPQMVIDGRFDVVGSDRGRVLPLLAGRPAPVTVTLSRDDDHVVADLGAGAGNGTVIAYGVRTSARTQPTRGENGGRQLVETNIVRSVHVLGRWTGPAARFQLALTSLPADADEVVVVVQADGPGPTLGAAKLIPRLDELDSSRPDGRDRGRAARAGKAKADGCPPPGD